MAYDQIEPLPDRRVELLLATLLALTTNIHRDPKKSDPVRAVEFLPWLREETDNDDGMDQAAMIRWIEQMNIAMGGRDERVNHG